MLSHVLVVSYFSLWLSNIPFYEYTTFILSLADGHLDGFHVLAVMNSAAVSIVYKFLCKQSSAFISPEYIPRNGWAI